MVLKVEVACCLLAGLAFHFSAGVLTQFSDDNDHFNRVLSGIMKPRVVGSRGHAEVKDFILRELKELMFKTEVDEFSQSVPILGNVTFTNIIGVMNPDAHGFLTLSCHYDSKYFADNPDFVGAVDSAVPCAMLLNAVKTLSNYLTANLSVRNDIGLMLLFFDGEEAFKDWSHTDSLYGSRHLATKLSKTKSKLYSVRNIDRIEVLVLLDLIGAATPKFYSYYPNTHGLHNSLADIEKSLAKSQNLEGHNLMFMKSFSPGGIEDDHLPFLNENVPILHIIPQPFPPQWHTADDDGAHLHWPTIRNFNKIFRMFVYEYIRRHKGPVNLRGIYRR